MSGPNAFGAVNSADSITLFNSHSGEEITFYRSNNSAHPSGFAAIEPSTGALTDSQEPFDRFLRDHHMDAHNQPGSVFAGNMDTRLIGVMFGLRNELVREGHNPGTIEVVSGYRSNWTIDKITKGVQNSQHTQGTAIDIRFRDADGGYIDAMDVSREAWHVSHSGGVGHYPDNPDRAGYTHIDTARERFWGEGYTPPKGPDF